MWRKVKWNYFKNVRRCTTGHKITAGQRTMSGQKSCLSGQIWRWPDMMSGHFFLYLSCILHVITQLKLIFSRSYRRTVKTKTNHMSPLIGFILCYVHHFHPKRIQCSKRKYVTLLFFILLFCVLVSLFLALPCSSERKEGGRGNSNHECLVCMMSGQKYEMSGQKFDWPDMMSGENVCVILCPV